MVTSALLDRLMLSACDRYCHSFVTQLHVYIVVASDNNIGVEGAKVLAPVVRKLTKLTKLYVRSEWCSL